MMSISPASMMLNTRAGNQRLHYTVNDEHITCQHYAEHESWEVVVEVENSAHEVERKIVQCPPQQQPQTTRCEHRQSNCSEGEREGRGERRKKMKTHAFSSLTTHFTIQLPVEL